MNLNVNEGFRILGYVSCDAIGQKVKRTLHALRYEFGISKEENRLTEAKVPLDDRDSPILLSLWSYV